MATVQEKIAQAKAAGYTDEQISSHLASTPEFGEKIKTATAAGYKASDIVSHLSDAKAAPAAEQPGIMATAAAALGKGVGSTMLGIQRLAGKGLSAIGDATSSAPTLSGLVTGDKPTSMAGRAGKWLQDDANQGQARLTEQLAPYKAANPMIASIGEGAGEIIPTLPAGGLITGALRVALPAATAIRGAPLLNAISSAGFRTGAAPAATLAGKAADLGIRSLGGGITGGVSAGLVNPDDAGMGAMIGGALPGAAKAAGFGTEMLGKGARKIIASNAVAPEVAQLADRAKQLGIDIPADRIANSKLLNATAASLNYVPFSGRAATEKKMQDQLNRALSRTFGQDTDQVTMGLRKASEDLGGEFDRVLQANTVRVDEPFLAALSQAETRAAAELETGQASIIKKQIDEIMAKASETGQIDGQAAYNIKKTLDRIGKRNSPEAFYAIDLKGDLMEALNRSMTPADAAAFAKTRQHYGSMLTLDKLAQNGVDGDVSIARIANMKNIGNKDLQELADISAQFLKAREGQHGAMQRVSLGGLAAFTGYPGALATGVVAGRSANALLNSNMLKNAVMGRPSGSNRLLDMITDPRLQQQAYRAAPVAGSN